MTEKILVTLGPSSLNQAFVEECSKLGVYVFRINLSHTAIEDVAPTIEKIRQWTDTPICLDSEGAQLRNQKIIGGRTHFSKGEMVKIHHQSVVGDRNNISFSPEGLSYQFVEGDLINVDFDHVLFRIVQTNEECCIAKVLDGGEVGSNKAANLDRDLDFNLLTEKDGEAIKIGLDMDIRHFALSFANRAQDVKLIRRLCRANANIICKIESLSGLLNLEEIIQEADEILINRGDLSRTVPIEKIPFLQRRIISIALSRSTPVFVATNLLESMVRRKSPTRAEVNDVVSTLLMGADGLVLAAETAIGDYPIDCVLMVRKLIEESKKWASNTSLLGILSN